MEDVERAPSRLVVWTTYAYLGLFVYLEYGVGLAAPYLRADLGLSDFVTGLHGAAIGIGAVTAAAFLAPLARAIGGRGALVVSLAALCLGAGLVGSAPLLACSLAGALLIGIGGGGLTTQTNVALGGSGGALGRRLLGRANAWAMGGGLAAPAILAAAAALGTWRLAMLWPIAAFAIVSAFRGGPAVAPVEAAGSAERLPRDFWLAALFVTLAVAVEFSIVFWGSSVVIARTGTAVSSATFLTVFFMAGMLLSRTLVGFGIANRFPRAALAVGLGIVAAGVLLTWVSTVESLSGAGLFLAGLGTGALYPVAVVAALRIAAGRELAAATRITFVSSGAIVVAPSLLGLLSDVLGVVAAWPVILAVIAVALAALYRLPGEAENMPEPVPVRP